MRRPWRRSGQRSIRSCIPPGAPFPGTARAYSERLRPTWHSPVRLTDDAGNFGEVVLEVGVEAAVDLVETVVGGVVYRAGHGLFVCADDAAAGRLNGGIDAGSDAGQQRYAERGSLVHVDGHVRVAG